VASEEQAFDINGAKVQKLRQQVLNVWKLRAYMLVKLPAALFCGLRVDRLDQSICHTSVPYGWRTTNPFQSMYFAVQAMAAEMSTGALGLSVVNASSRPLSMLIVGMDAQFTKKAASRVTFVCEAGQEMAAAVAKTLETGESVKVTALSIGTDEQGSEVARFHFTWSFKRKT